MKMTSDMRANVEAAIRKHPDRSDSAIRALFKRRGGNLLESAAVVAEVRAGMDGAAQAKPTPQAPVGDTVAVGDVLAGYDAVGKVLELVKEIPAGRLRKDESLRVEMRVGMDKWRAIRNSIRVSGYVYQLPNKEYVWGSKSTIAGIPAKLRELLA